MIRFAAVLISLAMCSVAVGQQSVFDVRRFGATTDDATDDTTAIVAAITAASEYTASGVTTEYKAEVIFQRGTYIVTTLSVSGDRITFRGNGATLTKAAAGSEDQLLNFTSASSDCEVHDLTIDSQYPTYTSSGEGTGIYLSGTRTTMHNVFVKNTSGRGIVDSATGWQNRIYNLRTENTGRSGIITRGDWFEIHDCQITDFDATNVNAAGFLGDSNQYDADSLIIKGLRIKSTVQKNKTNGFLIDAGDNAATGSSVAILNIGDAGAGVGAAVNNRGKVQWAIDSGHGIKPGDGFLVDNTGRTEYDGSTSAGRTHRVIAVTGDVYVRPTSTTAFTLHTSSAGAVANTGQVTLSSTGTGIFYVKCFGSPRNSVTCGSGVNTGTGVITTDTVHGFRPGQSVRLTIGTEGTDELPGGLNDAALITVNTAYAGAGTAGKYTRPKRYTKVVLQDYDFEVIPGNTTLTALTKIANISLLVADRMRLDGLGQTVDNNTLQLTQLRKAVFRECRVSGRTTFNVRSWCPNVSFDNCQLGGGDFTTDYAIEQLQCGKLSIRDSLLRFNSAAISTPVIQPDDFRDEDCDYVELVNNTFEAATTSRGRIIDIDSSTLANEHLGRSGILRYYGNVRRAPLYTGLAISSIDTATDIVEATVHSLETGDWVTFDNTGGALPTVSGTALDETSRYFVRRLGPNTFTLHYQTVAGDNTGPANASGNANAVDFTGSGSGTNVLMSPKLGVHFSNNGPRDAQFFQKNGNGHEFIAAAVPTNNTFQYHAGDIVWNMNPAVAEPVGWVCTVTGVRGTTSATFEAMPPPESGQLYASDSTDYNVGTGEDNLKSYTLPTNIAGSAGDVINVEAHFTIADTARTKRIRGYWNGNVVYDSAAHVHGGGGNVAIRMRGIYSATGVASVYTTAVANDATSDDIATGTPAAVSVSVDGGDIIKFTAEVSAGAADSEVVHEYMTVQFLPKP